MQQTSLKSKQWPRESLQSLQSPRHQRGTMAGKLKGTMEATTPTGRRTFLGHPFRNETREVPRAQKETEHVLLPSNFCWPFSNHSTPIQSHRNWSMPNPRNPRMASWHQTPLATSKIRPAKRSGKPVAKATVSRPASFNDPWSISMTYET